jgi:hypothetical protein
MHRSEQPQNEEAGITAEKLRIEAKNIAEHRLQNATLQQIAGS